MNLNRFYLLNSNICSNFDLLPHLNGDPFEFTFALSYKQQVFSAKTLSELNFLHKILVYLNNLL